MDVSASTQSDVFTQNGSFSAAFPFDCQKEFTFSEVKQSAQQADNKASRAGSAAKKAKTPSRSVKPSQDTQNSVQSLDQYILKYATKIQQYMERNLALFDL